jgi:hypothetical protein
MTVGFVASASARNLSVTTESVRATWERISFTEPSFGLSVVCGGLTLEGSLHARTFVKGSYNLVGNITRAIIAGPGCAGGDVTVLSETLPWSLRYESFTGTLPDITSTRLLLAGAAFRIHNAPANITCLFTTRETVAEHARGTLNREAGGAIASVSISGTITSNEGCVLGERVRGRLSSGSSASATVLNSASRITLTLI